MRNREGDIQRGERRDRRSPVRFACGDQSTRWRKRRPTGALQLGESARLGTVEWYKAVRISGSECDSFFENLVPQQQDTRGRASGGAGNLPPPRLGSPDATTSPEVSLRTSWEALETQHLIALPREPRLTWNFVGITQKI